MRYFSLLLFVALLNSVVFTSHSQQISTTKHAINWTGFEKWSVDSTSFNVPNFVDAIYPSGNGIPHFSYRIAELIATDYNVKIINEEYESATNAEIEFLAGQFIGSEIQLQKHQTKDREQLYLNVEIMPYVKKGNQILKLKNFDLQIESISAISKVTKSAHSYNNTSVLSSGKFVKIKIKDSGIYRITYEELQSMGVNPANVRVFGYGGALLEQNFTLPKPDDLPEVAIWMEKGADGVFNAGDYILFYGQGLVKWKYNTANKTFTHTLNHYANEGYYFLTSDVGEGKKIQSKSISIPPNTGAYQVYEFVDYDLHEVEKYNLGNTGKVFYGEEFNTKLSYNFPFSFPNITSGAVSVRLDLAAASSPSSSFRVKLNNANEKSVSLLGTGTNHQEIGKGTNTTLVFPSNNNSSQEVNLTYVRSDNSSRGYLNYIEITAKRELKMVGSEMYFRNVDNLNTPVYNTYYISDANANVQIWDITDPLNIIRIETTQDGNFITFSDTNSQLKQYLAIDPTAKNSFTLSPTSVGVIANQNIHGLPAAEMIIISHPSFMQQAERLAAAHRTTDGFTVHVMSTEQVFNEFSSGTPDASAYRWAVKMFYDRAVALGDMNLAPKYLLLFGRGTFDNRGLISNSGDNLILTYQADQSLHSIDSYVTDDYFGFLDDNEGIQITSDMADVGIGRIPAVTVKHAEDVVNKIIGYMQNDIKGNWKNQLTFVADDGDNHLHVGQADGIARTTASNHPSYDVQKIYLDAYLQEVSASGESYPLAEKKLKNLINSGTFYLNFMGHASSYGWTNERILSSQDVKELYNTKLPFWVAATCDFVLFDTKDISAGENVLLNPSGGGIGIVAAARTVYANQNEQINKHFTQYLFTKKNGEHRRLGDAIREAKNIIGTQTNKLSYVLLGDPALRLNYPTEYSVTTEEINGNPMASTDTLRALSVNTIKGFVRKNGVKATDFNGTVEITILDKKQNITTLNNHKDKDTFTYQDRPNTLYVGKSVVKNGEFEFTFMVPKDIRYNYGLGKIVYYVSDDNKEGQGNYENFTVGGMNKSFEDEKDGPNIQMYLNTPSFKSGDKVNETPLFVANISDYSGINMVGSGIGHDLRLIIDNDPNTSYTLNENFEADQNSYKSGKVQMKLINLSAGKHTLTFYAWDLLNNSSSETFEFEVVPGLTPVIFGVRNYPNPAKSSTTFIVEHDRPEVILDTKLDIFDLTGQMIHSKSFNSSDNLKWDLKDGNGNRVKQGIYLYRVSVSTTNSEWTSNANKIIVLEQ